MDNLNDSRLWAQVCGWYERVQVMSLRVWMIWMSLVHELKFVDDMNDSNLWAKGSRFFEQLKVVDDMID